MNGHYNYHLKLGEVKFQKFNDFFKHYQIFINVKFICVANLLYSFHYDQCLYPFFLFMATDPVERACIIISKRIERDWAALYRALPFHPLRGSETISQDIVNLTTGGARGANSLVARRSLDRWRRYHTRSSVDDLKQALRKIRRLDILKVVDLVLKPPVKVITAPFEVIEEPPPPVEEHLIPYYRLIERYDQSKANRIAAEAEAERRKQARRVIQPAISP